MLSRVMLAVMLAMALAVLGVNGAKPSQDTTQAYSTINSINPSRSDMYTSDAPLNEYARSGSESSRSELLMRQVPAADYCGAASCGELYRNAKRQCALGIPAAKCAPESAPGAAAACKWYRKGYTDGGCVMSIQGTSVSYRVPTTLVMLDQYGSMLDIASVDDSFDPLYGFDASQDWIGDAIGRAKRSVKRADPVSTLNCGARWAGAVACIKSGGGQACLASVPTDDVCYQWLEKSL